MTFASKPSIGRSLYSSALLLAMIFASAIPGRAQNASTDGIFSAIKKSLAHVIVHEGKSEASGTGFCIGSHDGTAYILTNKHVVGSDPRPRVVLLSDPDSELYGRVDRTSSLDAAIVAVDNASCTPVVLNATLPTVGASIGIAGFPAFQLQIATDATSAEPSFHAGSVSALPAGGALIEYDAQTDRGNSGSPLFDTKSGEVVGLVVGVNTGSTGALQNNLSLSINGLASFLSHSRANVVLNGSAPSSPTSLSTPSPGSTTAAALIDSRCGPDVRSEVTSTLFRVNGELSANDYVSTMQDARTAIETTSSCAIKFVCPGSSCNEDEYTLMTGSELLAQQALRIATARSSGDSVNALRNELSTALTLCAMPSIMTDAQPYNFAREAAKASFKLSRVIHAVGPYRGIVDADAVRDCATKFGV